MNTGESWLFVSLSLSGSATPNGKPFAAGNAAPPKVTPVPKVDT